MKLNIKAIYSSEMVLSFYALTLQDIYYKSFTQSKVLLRNVRNNKIIHIHLFDKSASIWINEK